MDLLVGWHQAPEGKKETSSCDGNRNSRVKSEVEKTRWRINRYSALTYPREGGGTWMYVCMFACILKYRKPKP